MSVAMHKGLTSDHRFTFSRDQIQAYFDRIQLPEEHRRYGVAGARPGEQLEYLSLLQKHHLINVPFENLTLHYSSHRQISIHPEALFKKIVSDKNGRGGYCMENNCLFGTLLLSLGFTIFSAGGRVFDSGRWSGWSHMVNIVTIGGDRRYHVDVGFGADGPIVPMELDRAGPIQPHISPASVLLQWRNINGNSDPNQRLWVYEHRVNQDADFKTWYCFTELEYIPADYSIMNYYTSTSPKTFFTRTIVVEKKILGDDGQRLVGNLILNGAKLKWRINGKTEKEIIFEKEDERIRALADHFNINFDLVERDAICGLASELM